MWVNLGFIHWGYVMVFLLVGMHSLSCVSPNNKIIWVDEHFALAPGPVIIVSPTKSDDEKSCSEISVDECLQKLQTFLKLKSLPFTSEESELNKLCSNTIAGYNCSATKSSIPNCLSSRDKYLISGFVEMAQYTMNMFCREENGEIGYLRKALLQNSECILKQKEALDCCVESSKLMDLPVMHVLEQSSKSIKYRQMAACCPVANYLKCAVPIVEKNCGETAKNLTMMYVRRSSGEPLEAVCQKMPDYPEPNTDICEIPPPVCSGSRVGILLELITLMCIVFVMRISHL